MKLVTFLDSSSRPHIGALAPDGRIVDLPAASRLRLQKRATAAHDALPNDMRQLFEGGDRSLDLARAALDFAVEQKPDKGADGEPIFYERDQIHLKAPHLTRVSRIDEVSAARKPVVRWKPETKASQAAD